MSIIQFDMPVGWESIAFALAKREPKTPMAFYNRMLWVLLALIVAPLYSNINADYKLPVLAVGIGFAVVLVVWVTIFAWKKPDHLLYGAETHFEKWKEERKQPGGGQTLVSSPPSHDTPEGVVANQ